MVDAEPELEAGGGGPVSHRLFVHTAVPGSESYEKPNLLALISPPPVATR